MVSILLIALTIIISLVAWQKPDLMGKMLMNPYRIQHRNEYWRFVSSGFIHADFTHLFFNLFSFFFFGVQLERIFNQLFPTFASELYILFYVLAIVAADFPTFNKHKNNPNYNSLGASGAVSAVIFAGILFFPLEPIYLFGVLKIPGIIYAGLFTWYSIEMDKRSRDFVNHSAHLYGGLFGIMAMTLLYPKVWISFVEQIMSLLR
ncbi:rhomboid family intramembrane serine protease [Aquirufa sp. HETE-83D]|uniref:Rhomboid family intramembrane serine protease n=1 Tax=Aquirufa esocilacus TaxID=3096513 RepID=A0ABW6DK43_9BACT